MKAILGKKLGMTQIFEEDGRVIIVTVIEAGPAKVVQKKGKEKDGYEALQVGFDLIRKEKNVTRPMMGHFRKASVSPYRFLREVEMEGFNEGDDVTVDIFSKGEKVVIIGTSKGKGFQGVMKRHNYGGGPGSHGSMFNRAPGSIGQGSWPSRVWKNTGLPGHMGDARVTVKNLEIIDIKSEQNLMLVKGAVPGANGGYLVIKSEARITEKES
ncbi:MAG: 50S ribosomal protein L3 [Nitrospirota bacterium]